MNPPVVVAMMGIKGGAGKTTICAAMTSAMHIARRAMVRATGTGWSLRRLRARASRAGARLTLSTAAAGF